MKKQTVTKASSKLRKEIKRRNDKWYEEHPSHVLENLKFSTAERDKIQRFIDEQDKAVAKKQGSKHPYYGTSGGGYIYTIIPTGLGNVIKIKNANTDKEIDVTEYELW